MFLQIYLIIILYIYILPIYWSLSLFFVWSSQKHHIQLHRTTLVQHILPEHNHTQHVAQHHSTTTACTQYTPGNKYIHHLNCHQHTIDLIQYQMDYRDTALSYYCHISIISYPSLNQPIWPDALDFPKPTTSLVSRHFILLICIYVFVFVTIFCFPTVYIDCHPQIPAEETVKEGRNVRPGLCPNISKRYTILRIFYFRF